MYSPPRVEEEWYRTDWTECVMFWGKQQSVWMSESITLEWGVAFRWVWTVYWNCSTRRQPYQAKSRPYPECVLTEIVGVHDFTYNPALQRPPFSLWVSFFFFFSLLHLNNEAGLELKLKNNMQSQVEAASIIISCSSPLYVPLLPSAFAVSGRQLASHLPFNLTLLQKAF